MTTTPFIRDLFMDEANGLVVDICIYILTDGGSLIAERTETTTNGVTEYDINFSMGYGEEWIGGDGQLQGMRAPANDAIYWESA